MQFDGLSISLVVVSAAVLAGVVVAFVNSRAPIYKFFSTSGDFVLMRFVYRMIGYPAFAYLLAVVFGLLVTGRAGQAAKLSFSALLFVFSHWLVTLRTWGGCLYALVANSFGVSFLFALKSLVADNACFTDAMGVGVEVRSTGPTSANCLLSKKSNPWGLLAAVRAGVESRLIAFSAYPIVSCVGLANFTSILHVPNLPQVAH